MMSATTQDSKRLHLIELGNNDNRVVFLHGLGGTHRYWTSGPQPPLFPAYRTVLVDLLGFGDSPRPWCRYTIDRHLEALHRSLKGHGPMTLVGHSLGAILAVAYAARYPQAVERLLLISLPYFANKDAADHWFRRMPGGWIFTNMAATALACVLTRRVVGHVLPYVLCDLPRPIAEDLVKHNVMSSTTSLWEVLYRHDLVPDVAALPSDVPVHCIHGTADETAPADGLRVLAAGRANWRPLFLDGIDHHPWLRRPHFCHHALGCALAQS
jgi:pimeloyl-ACP methyl ester carboxylesterase